MQQPPSRTPSRDGRAALSVVAAALVALLAAALASGIVGSASARSAACSRIDALGLEKQMRVDAAQFLASCGREPAGRLVEPASAYYTITTQTGQGILPGQTDISIHCDDCMSPLTFPFPIRLYGQQYTAAQVSSNGNIQFGSDYPYWFDQCLPVGSLGAAVAPYLDDLTTDILNEGIFTSTIGGVPNRTFIVEWRTTYAYDYFQAAHFEALFNEADGVIRFRYGVDRDHGASAVIGIQGNSSLGDSYSCDTSSLSNPNFQITYTPTVPPPPPPPPATPVCDDFADSSPSCRLTELESSPPVLGTRLSSNATATGETGEPDHAGSSIPLNSLWYHFTPTVSNLYYFHTCTGTGFDTTLAAYTGASVSTLTPAGGDSNNDSCGLQSRIAFVAYAGTTYHIAVEGVGSAVGSYRVTFSPRPPRPVRLRPVSVPLPRPAS